MLQFRWDDRKNRANKAKHGVSFETASLIWNDPDHMIIPDAVYDGVKMAGHRNCRSDHGSGRGPCHAR
ncbi:BrnT family toxin [Rhizobium binxianense]